MGFPFGREVPVRPAGAAVVQRFSGWQTVDLKSAMPVSLLPLAASTSLAAEQDVDTVLHHGPTGR
jgi:hypothetical protein